VNFGLDGTTIGKIGTFETATLEEKLFATEQIWISAIGTGRFCPPGIVDNSDKPLSYLWNYVARGQRCGAQAPLHSLEWSQPGGESRRRCEAAVRLGMGAAI
jgi:hypothetical protein